MANQPLPSPEVLRQLLRYDPETGKLFWKEREGRKAFNTRFAGSEALTTLERGYLQGRILGRLCYAHRAIWKIVHGEIAFGDIDHINGDRADNRLCNLRNVNRQENMKNRRLSRNNSSGRVGVFQTLWGTWKADIGHNGETICLGSFPTMDEASRAREAAEIRLGYHKNHGRA